MLLVSGAHRPLLDRITAHVEPAQFEVVDDFSFTYALGQRAHTLLRVEGITGAGATPPPSASLDSLIRAAEAPCVSRVIVVTSRVDTDDDLRRLRRSGARYVIVRPPDVVDPTLLRGRRVLIPRDLADKPFVTLDALADAVTEVLRDETLMGVTIDVPPTGLASLEAHGVKPRVVPAWRAKVGRWFKQPVLGGDAQLAT